MSDNILTKNKLTSLFGLGEMQAIVAGTMGHDLATRHLEDILRPQLTDRNSTLRLVLKKEKTGVSAEALLSKIEALSPPDLVNLQRSVAAIHEQDALDLFADGGLLPDPNLLRSAGLVAPTTKVASGLCIVYLKSQHFVYELPFYCDFSKIMSIPDLNAEECAETAAQTAALLLSNPNDEDMGWLYRWCAQVMVKTSQHYLRIESDGDAVTIVPIDPKELRHDFSDGSMNGLALSGVNAP